jgi:uncharacterized membrane protein
MFGFPYRPFTEEQDAKIVSAVAEAEKNTSAEIKVHVTKYCKGDVMLAAANTFKKLEIDKTEQRNGVLIFLALEDHKVAILGDEGINNQVEDDYWQCTLDVLLPHFKKNEIAEGICAALDRIGEKLAVLFPSNDKEDNELDDNISYG